MVRDVALAAVLLAGCWRDGPGAAPPPLRPETAAAPPRPRWRHGRQGTVAARSERTQQDIAASLAQQLRAGAPPLAAFVAGPIVVLDLDANTLTTVCDAAAIAGAQQWGALLAAPGRTAPFCRPTGQGYLCTQLTPQSLVVLELADPDQWRIVSVVVGNLRTGRAAMTSRSGQFRNQIATATCP